VRRALPCLGILAAILAFQAVRPGRPRADRSPSRSLAPAPGAPLAAKLLFAGRLDLNQAGEGDLRALPGLGPARAAAVLELRGRRGAFRRVDDLLDVPGVGRTTLERLRPFVTVQGEADVPEAPDRRDAELTEAP
jgi:competence protein ComEA